MKFDITLPTTKKNLPTTKILFSENLPHTDSTNKKFSTPFLSSVQIEGFDVLVKKGRKQTNFTQKSGRIGGFDF